MRQFMAIFPSVQLLYCYYIHDLGGGGGCGPIQMINEERLEKKR